MLPKELIKNILSDIRVELKDEFDKNFERKSFFNQKWARRKFDYRGGSLMSKSGALRRSIRAQVSAHGISFITDVPYASIHNNSGEIAVTRKMKGFFWKMYYKEGGKIKTLKNGSKSHSKVSIQANDLAEFYKAMALKKVGDKIKIPQRQFIGSHPNVEAAVRAIIEENVNEYFNNLKILEK